MSPEADRRELEISELCQACGVCCDGTMYSAVDLDPQASPEVRRRLRVVDGQETLRIPCEHLEGTRCGVYDVRPPSCKAYECKQVKEHRAVGGPIASRVETVLAVRALSHRLREVARAELGREPEFTHWHLYRSLEAGSEANLSPVVALDLIELAVRIQRDLGWLPPK